MQQQAQFAGLKDLQEAGNAKSPRRERKRCVAWTEEEHRNFLIGMEVLGVGNWKGVSQVYVPTRSAPQIASHAQKYFMRVGDKGKKRARPSLFDLDMEELEKLVVAKKAALDARAKEGSAADAKAQPRTYKARGREAYPNAAAAAAAAAAPPPQGGESLLSEVQAQARIQQLQAQVDRLQAQADRLTKGAAPSAAAAAAPGPSPDLLGLIAHASQVQLQVEEHRRELLKAYGGDGAQEGAQEKELASPLPSSPTGHSLSNLKSNASDGAAAALGPKSTSSPSAAPSPRLTDIKGSGGKTAAAVPKASLAIMTPNLTHSGPLATAGHRKASSGQGAGLSSLLSSSFGLIPVPTTPHAVTAPLPALSALPTAQIHQGAQMHPLSQLQTMLVTGAKGNQGPSAKTGPAPLLAAAFPQAQTQPFSSHPTMNLVGFNGMPGFALGSGGLAFGPGGLNLFNLSSAQAGFAPADPSHGAPYFAAPMGLHAQFPPGGIFLSMAQPQGQTQGMAFAHGGAAGQVFL